MRRVRTARGRTIDMGSIVKQNEEVRAVSPGNVKMNARGDHIDSKGNVINTVRAKSRAVHDTKSAPEKKALGDTPGTKTEAKKASAKTTAKKAAVMAEPSIVNETTREREDGSKYIEIEYDDGSIETREV